MAETLEIAQDVARRLIESYREHGDELPPSLMTKHGASVDLHIPISLG